MDHLSFLLNLEYMDIIIYIIRTFFICVCTCYTCFKLVNCKNFIGFKLLISSSILLIISIIAAVLKYNFGSFTSILFLICSLCLTFTLINKNTLGNSILTIIISLSINYSVFLLSLVINFIPNIIFKIQDDYISLCLILIIYILLIYLLFKVRKFKNGFSFLQKNLNNEYFDVLILNISVTILFSFTILSNFNLLLTTNLFIGSLIFATIMFITIQKSLTLYYKHNLLVKDLEDTKAELDEKNKEIEKLEKEALEFSKTSHSIAHKQRALEFKLNELMLNNEIADELDIRDRINNVSKECFSNSTTPKLPKTEIAEIDDMLKFLQHECVDNNIDFELQLNGNIYHLINTFIPKEDLTILLADHIKNSIIAINNSNNINKSILVRLGLIDNYYSLYVYDSGIEFEPETLSVLGKKPITTHSDSGGTGFGFMNTFDTLKKYKASLIINELNPPCEDNYTKSIIIRFDGKNEFKVNSYRIIENN